MPAGQNYMIDIQEENYTRFALKRVREGGVISWSEMMVLPTSDIP